ncbi:MAG: polysaccharide biosynthesis protein [Spirochaetales bacterium]|nr:polysaccharide biosynthesis protein [Spirochaetales bacterium]
MNTHKSTICIIGAGFAGREIFQEYKKKGILGKVVAFVDDDTAKIGSSIDGIPVLGPIETIAQILEHYPAQEALIAIPGATRQELRRIYTHLEAMPFRKIRILPSLSQIIDGNAHLIQAREISTQDILGRTPAAINLKESLAYLRHKRVLITGAGGSIGSELCRQLLSGGADRLYLFDHAENNVYEVERELRLLQEEGVGEKAIIVPVIGDLKDADYMRFILKRLKADIVFHCAAYKHVPLAEYNPVESVKNNVFGTQNLLDAAVAAGVKRMVLISTDKAVDPECIYGASKLICEDLVLSYGARYLSDFMAVRFGNVLESRGSIIPLFKQQIAKGGPVTITHKDASRFFMTIPEAVSLVLKAGGVGTGGTCYLLDMGEPVNIRDLAEQIIRFYGYTPGEEISIQYIGLRPGEKLHESLVSTGESIEATSFPRINKIIARQSQNGKLSDLLSALKPVCYFNPSDPTAYRNRRLLRAAVRNYVPSVPENPHESEY